MSNFAFEGPKWATSVLSYSFAPAGGSFSNAITGAYQIVIQSALSRWARAANLTFTQVSDTANPCIRFGWSQFSGSQIGETNYSYTAGDTRSFLPGVTVRLEDPAARSLGTGANDQYQGTSTTLYPVALHEIGHALGLDHSTDGSSVMYASVGPSNADLDASDIQGIQALYGTPAATTAAVVAATAPILPATVSVAAGTVAVYRFFDTSSGTQFLTGSSVERDKVITTRPDLTYEGLGLIGIAPGADPRAIPVFRFFDLHNGTHFFTTSASEQADIAANRPDLAAEQTTFFEHATPQAGDVAVYRFFDKTDGTHFFTANSGERASIISSRPDMAYEGVAFYAPGSA